MTTSISVLSAGLFANRQTWDNDRVFLSFLQVCLRADGRAAEHAGGAAHRRRSLRRAGPQEMAVWRMEQWRHTGQPHGSRRGTGVSWWLLMFHWKCLPLTRSMPVGSVKCVWTSETYKHEWTNLVSSCLNCSTERRCETLKIKRKRVVPRHRKMVDYAKSFPCQRYTTGWFVCVDSVCMYVCMMYVCVYVCMNESKEWMNENLMIYGA